MAMVGGGPRPVDDERADARPEGAVAVLRGQVTAVQRLVGAHGEEVERAAEDGGVGLRGAHLRARQHGGEMLAERQSLEDVGKRTVPIADDGQHDAARAERLEGGRHIGERPEPERVDEEPREMVGPGGVAAEAVREDAGAVAAQVGERRGVPAAVEMAAVVGDLTGQGGGHALGRMVVPRGREGGPQPGHRVGQAEQGSVGVEENSPRGYPGRVGRGGPGGYDRPPGAARRGDGMRGERGRIILGLACVAVLAAIVLPAAIAGRFADGPGGAEVGIARVDRGWEFVYHAVRLSRGARLGTDEAALARAREVWAGRPRAEEVELVYMDGAFPVPVPEGGVAPAPERATARPLSRLGWVVRGRIGAGPEQMIGVLDYASGRVAWNIRPLPAATA